MFAMENELVRADMVEAIEFPHLANKYEVYGVPRTVINDKIHQEGAVPEPVLLAKVLQALVPQDDEESETSQGNEEPKAPRQHKGKGKGKGKDKSKGKH